MAGGIITMTPEQQAAFINAQTQMMVTERIIMEAENKERELQGLSPAHGSKQFADFEARWKSVLGYNELIMFFRE
jgi:hypothetical protein